MVESFRGIVFSGVLSNLCFYHSHLASDLFGSHLLSSQFFLLIFLVQVSFYLFLTLFILTPSGHAQLNLKANYILIHHFLPKRSRKASIIASVPRSIHLSSPTHISGQSAYLSSKIALVKFLEVVAAENPDLFVASYDPGNGQSFQTFSPSTSYFFSLCV